jgi:hypothetical protein
MKNYDHSSSRWGWTNNGNGGADIPFLRSHLAKVRDYPTYTPTPRNSDIIYHITIYRLPETIHGLAILLWFHTDFDRRAADFTRWAVSRVTSYSLTRFVSGFRYGRCLRKCPEYLALVIFNIALSQSSAYTLSIVGGLELNCLLNVWEPIRIQEQRNALCL